MEIGITNIISMLVAIVAVAFLLPKFTGRKEPHFYGIPPDDAEMLAASEKARATFPDFLQALEKGDPLDSGFEVKLPFEENGIREHIWIDDPVWEEGALYGIVGNTPRIVKSISAGQKVPIDVNKISDWMYIRNDPENPQAKPLLKGGYTVRLHYSRVSPKERNALPFSMD